jgi:hypothetical protein
MYAFRTPHRFVTFSLVVGCAAPAPLPRSEHARNTLAANVEAAGPRGVIEAPHGGRITSLAVTPEGDAAVTGDELGGVRLWSALDGSREPRVLELAGARAFAIARTPEGFVVAMLDAVGGLTILRVAPDGRTAHRTVHVAEPAFAGVTAAAGGFVAWRADHTVARLDVDGAIIEHLAAQPGERILDLAVRGDRAVAAIQPATGSARARMLFVAPALAWGPMLPEAVVPSTGLAMSPNGVRIAALRGGVGAGRLVVFDAIKGAVTFERAVGGPILIGFGSESELAVAAFGDVTWLDVSHPERSGPVLGHGMFPHPTDHVLSIGGGRAVMAADRELMLVTPDGTHSYLGYGAAAPTRAAYGAPGELALGAGNRLVTVDSTLHARHARTVERAGEIAQLRWLGGGDWLVEYTLGRGADAEIAIALRGKRATLVRALRSEEVLQHEPTTGLATLGRGELAEVLRVERAPPKVVRVVSLPRDQYTSAYPTAPELAGGTRLVLVNEGDQTRVRWLQDPTQTLRGLQILVDGYLMAVGRAGHVFLLDGPPRGPGTLRVYRDGKQLGALAADASESVWPDLTGNAVLLVAPHGVRAISVDGTPRWTLALDGVQDVAWSTTGELVLVANGIVRVDASTGNVLDARCGWDFGLSPEPHATRGGEPVCTQLP